MFSNYSVNKPYTVIVAVILIAILGTVSFLNISTDLLPSINLPYAIIATPYIGASPEAVELNVTRLMESRMASVSNIKSIQSISRENMSLIILEFNATANMDSVFIEMRETLDSIKPLLPEGVTNSTMLKLNPNMMPIMVISAGLQDAPINVSSPFMQSSVIPELESVEGVASVELSGLVDNQIHIILSEQKIADLNEKIKRHMLLSQPSIIPNEEITVPVEQLPSPPEFTFPQITITTDMIAGVIKGQNFSMPTGYIAQDQSDYLIRTGQKLEDADALSSLPVMVLPIEGFDPVLIKDVADVVFVDNAHELYSKVNGNDAITLTIQKQTEFNTSDVSSRIHEKISALEGEYSNLRMVTLMDQGKYTDIVINSLLLNLVLGGLLAIIILFIFLGDLKPTLIVGFSIPISVVTAFVMMYFGNITLNIISMGGLALGVGMLVDNAIVVIENIYRMRNEGKSAVVAAVEGAKQVSGAIMASTLTTVAVFLPIVFVQGFTREIFQDMGLTIAFSLLASLIVALTFVPMMASKVLQKNIKKNHRIFDALVSLYTRTLKFALGHKLSVLIFAVILLAASFYGAFSIGTELFPSSDSGELNISLTLDHGTPFSEMTRVADELSRLIASLDSVQSVGASIGGGQLGMGSMGFASATNRITFYVSLHDNRNDSTIAVADQIKGLTTYELSIRGTDMAMGGMSTGDIAIQVSGRSFETLESLALQLADIIQTVPGTEDVSSGIEATDPEYRLIVDYEKSISKGLTTAAVFMKLNQLLKPDTAATTIPYGIYDYPVFVKNPTDQRQLTKETILDTELVSPTGEPVKIGDIADFVESTGFSRINRSNQQRYVTVTATIAQGYNIGLVGAAIESKISEVEIPEGYVLKQTGENQTIRDSFKDLFLMLALAIVFIYLIMVAQFQSLLSPFIVMFTIPLAFTGGFFGLIATGNPLSLVAFVGLIVLSGVVVNNGIVFVDYVNKMKEDGLNQYEALLKTGQDRLRPILMTALTTIFALSTMSLGAGAGTEMMQPMAITAIGGLIYATLLTLLIVPILYDLLHPKDSTKTFTSN